MDINHKYPLTKTVMVRKGSCRYELYDVQWGDYLYLKPENRIHIW